MIDVEVSDIVRQVGYHDWSVDSGRRYLADGILIAGIALGADL